MFKIDPNRYSHNRVHSRILHGSQKLGAPEASTVRWTDGHNVDKMEKTEGRSDTSHTAEDPGGHRAR